MQPTVAESCVIMHELFISLRAAGFSRQEALYIVACGVLNRGPWPPADQG